MSKRRLYLFFCFLMLAANGWSKTSDKKNISFISLFTQDSLGSNSSEIKEVDVYVLVQEKTKSIVYYSNSDTFFKEHKITKSVKSIAVKQLLQKAPSLIVAIDSSVNTEIDYEFLNAGMKELPIKISKKDMAYIPKIAIRKQMQPTFLDNTLSFIQHNYIYVFLSFIVLFLIIWLVIKAIKKGS